MSNFYDVLIVGAGHGGAQSAIALRQSGYQGSIAIVGDEPEFPYERPPLSKEYFSGERSFDRILIRPPGFWEERSVNMLLSTEITGVNPQAHEITSDKGEKLRYGNLIWAAGGKPRSLACHGANARGVHSIRTRADVDRVLMELGDARRVVVVGAGYIGLEAAAGLVKCGKQVVVLELLDRALARVAGEPLSRFYEKEHRSHGVDLRLNCGVESIIEKDRRVVGVCLTDGEVLDCEMVIVGIGIEPAVRPLLAAGARGGNGVEVDAKCRTSLPGIFAIGDCALHENAFANGSPVRLESVQNANDQAMVVAKTLVGAEASYDSVPWFWSNQYDLRLQTIGLSAGHDEAITRGQPEERSFSVVYLRSGRVVALDCVNATKDYVHGRALVRTGARIPSERLRSADSSLKQLEQEFSEL